MLGLAIPVADFNAYPHYRSVPATHSRATVAEGRPLPYFGGSGTGGIEGMQFAMSRQGYSPFTIIKIEPTTTLPTYAPYTDLMKEVKAGFGRTMSHLPAVSGVSRQTPKSSIKEDLYNWPPLHGCSSKRVSNQPQCRWIVPWHMESRSLNSLGKVLMVRKVLKGSSGSRNVVRLHGQNSTLY
jgi:hypothetical protein